MMDPLWTTVFAFLRDTDEACQRGEAEADKDPMQAFVRLRETLRRRLDQLKADLSETLNEREIYLSLFPLVAHLDESVQRRLLRGRHADWPPLQKELFAIDNGGEVVFELVEDLLRKPQTLPFVFEILYFVINDGFCGKYSDNKAKLAEVKRRLRERIPVPATKASDSDEEVEAAPPDRFPWWSYAASAVFLAAAYGALLLIATRS